MKVGIIGLGTIGSYVAKRIQKDRTLSLSFVFDVDKKKTKKFPKKIIAHSIDDALKRKTDLVAEAASYKAVNEYGAKILRKTNLLIMSGTALAYRKTEKAMRAACRKHGTKLYMAEGAIIGLDGIREVSGQLRSVEIVTRKPPKGFGRADKKERVLFKGTARQACKKFPKNVNVSATLSMNGIGFDRTKAKIISDPKAKANSHTIFAEGDFGKFTIKVAAKPSKNPRTSGVAAISCFEMVKRVQKGISIY